MLIPIIRRTTRRAPIFFPTFLFLILLILVYRSRYLLALLFESGSRDVIYPSTLLSPFSDMVSDQDGNHTQLIPKIIHQTYKTESSIPLHWRAGQQAVKDLHPDWEYMFWDDAAALSFIQTHYPSYLKLYNSYPHPIQRSDVLRYFLLYHFGGIYLDLDLTPYQPLTPLLSFPSGAFACLTSPTGISNDAMGSLPGHSFFERVINELEGYRRRWWIGWWFGGEGGYVGVMYSTGPLFLSVVWVKFLRMGGRGRLNILVQEKGIGEGYSFFRNQQGSSWHRKDTKTIFWMGRHWVLVVVVGVSGIVSLVLAVWWMGGILGRWWERRTKWKMKSSGDRYRELV